MKNIRAEIRFDGSRFKGWQKLGQGERTVQGTLERLLGEVLNEEVSVVGCGRTDAGVHGLNYVLNFHTKTGMKVEFLSRQLTEKLPSDIQLIRMLEVDDRFHAQHNVSSKTYLFKIDNRKVPNLFMRRYEVRVDDRLNVTQMKKAAENLVGKHDFQSFTTVKSKKKSTVRTITSIEVEDDRGEMNIRVTGDGFLWNMVRIIVGTLVEVGKGNVTTEEVITILEAKERATAPGKMPPYGLYLEKVEYETLKVHSKK